MQLANGTTRRARAMGPWRPLAYPRARIEWCLALADAVLVAVRARGAARIVGVPATDATLLDESHARAAVDAHGGPERLMKDAPLGWDLDAKGFLHEGDVAAFLSMQYRVPTIDLEAFEVAPEILALVSAEVCTMHRVLPVSRSGGSLILAMSDPSDAFAIDAVAAVTGLRVEPVVAAGAAIRGAIVRYYGQ